VGGVQVSLETVAGSRGTWSESNMAAAAGREALYRSCIVSTKRKQGGGQRPAAPAGLPRPSKKIEPHPCKKFII
jgi:hypothetical protein